MSQVEIPHTHTHIHRVRMGSKLKGFRDPFKTFGEQNLPKTLFRQQQHSANRFRAACF